MILVGIRLRDSQNSLTSGKFWITCQFHRKTSCNTAQTYYGQKQKKKALLVQNYYNQFSSNNIAHSLDGF